MTRRLSDRGSITLELAVLAVPALLVVGALAHLRALPATRLRIDLATQDAARAATLQRSPAAAAAAAQRTAAAGFRDEHAGCQRPTIHTDLHDFRPGGSVTVQLTCPTTVEVFGVTVHRTLTATATAPVDRYRGTR